jgi:allophanate hydrolase
MLHACLHTTSCTVSVSTPPRHPPPATAAPWRLADWRAAYARGARPGALLGELVERLRARTGDAALIHLIAADRLAARCAALEQAAAGVGRTSLAQALPLFGVPFAVKDNLDIEGEPTTAACPAYAYTARASATVVRRLEAAGAVWVAKTNLDQFATGLVGTRSPYGRPASVADAGRISGGSSSGSAVLVARGDVPFALGTDTAGSGRVPAGFNGLVGLKPTPGRVGSAGVVPACRSLDCVSVFAHGVDDAAEVLALIEGADDTDPYSRFEPGPAALPAAPRLGVPAAPVFFGDAGYAQAWQRALDHARALGARLVPLDFAVLDEVAALLYDGPWVAERHAVVRELLATRPDAFDPAVRRIVASAQRWSATDAFAARQTLQALARRAAALWRDCDALLVPTAPGHPSFAEVDADPIGVNAALGRYTNFVNLLGWSALALPAGQASHGLPFGVTLIGAAGADAALARYGRRWSGTDEAPLPPAWPASEAALPIAVVGAHLSGLPLNGQLTERGATLLAATQTAPHYRLHALPGTQPPKPGLVRCTAGGAAIAVEVWSMPQRAVGSFLALIPPPLGLGSIELADGRWCHGFVCEAHAVEGAPDISAYGGWRAWLAGRSPH